MNESDGAAGEKLVARRRMPKRNDSRQTETAILESTALLLEDIGFEDLSTNMICKHAGLTPPAFYHYYPNKYAVLFELAHTLLTAQHATLSEWIENGGLVWETPAEGVSSFNRLQVKLRAVAGAQVGALWIIRGMRAIPKLRQVRIAAHDVMVRQLLSALCIRCPSISKRALAVPSFLLGEIIHLGTELELDHPERGVSSLRTSLSIALVSFISAIELTGSRGKHPWK